MSDNVNMEKPSGKVVEKISDLLEERKGERRKQTEAPTYLNPALDRRKNDRRGDHAGA
ncbi:MAG: hypothetical protein MI976_02410 [Pseudomonadales bacterium]|nr:hypothetical protein [Pseudomonadales bacterium]